MKVLFFARYRELLHCDEEIWSETNGIQFVQDVLDRLTSRGAPWDTVLSSSSLLVAINQEMASFADKVSINDEVAFFPPVTGG